MKDVSYNLSDYIRRIGSVSTSGLIAQLGHGNLQIFHSVLAGQECFIAHTRCRPLSIWSWEPKPEWVGIVHPLSWANDFRLNNWSARPGDVFWLDGKNDFRTIAADRNLVIAGVKRTAFAQAVANLRGSTTPVMRIEEECWNLKGLFYNLAKRRHSEPKLPKWIERVQNSDSREFSPTEESDFIYSIADLYLQNQCDKSTEFKSSKSSLRIVRSIESHIRHNEIYIYSIHDLCSISGVGKTRLHGAFFDVYGISPYQYLLKMRLSAVRDWLKDEQAPPLSVKDAALRYGFNSLGRFSLAYRSQFGEHPITTLAKAQDNTSSQHLSDDNWFEQRRL